MTTHTWTKREYSQYSHLEEYCPVCNLVRVPIIVGQTYVWVVDKAGTWFSPTEPTCNEVIMQQVLE